MNSTRTSRAGGRRSPRTQARTQTQTARLAQAALADHMDIGDSFMAAWTLDELDRDADLESVLSAWSHTDFVNERLHA